MSKTNQEKKNDEQIPAELKAQLTEKANKVLLNIGRIEIAINDAIDKIAEENPITISEIQAGLIKVMSKLNQREIMELLK